MIFTGSFKNVKDYNGILVSLSDNVPDNFSGIIYNKLSPHKYTGKNSVKRYLYMNQLDKYNPKKVLNEIYSLIPKAYVFTEIPYYNDKNIHVFLLTNENNIEFTYRGILAEWFMKNGIWVCEYITKRRQILSKKEDDYFNSNERKFFALSQRTYEFSHITVNSFANNKPTTKENNKTYKPKEAKPKPFKDGTKKFCPLCGNHLIERGGKFGRFYGCKSFPRCRYTAKI